MLQRILLQRTKKTKQGYNGVTPESFLEHLSLSMEIKRKRCRPRCILIYKKQVI